MSKTNCNNKRGQSFKAVENFLRRVAFNLGNSPSQTEVKIVSCIPIDVTDLQQRIFQLQTELSDIKRGSKKPGPTRPCAETVGCAVCARRHGAAPAQACCDDCLLTTTSVLSVYCPDAERPSFANLRSASSALSRAHHTPAPAPAPGETPDKSKPTSERQTSKHFFSKKKKESKNRSLRTQLVYHAQADTHTPFRNDVQPELARDATLNKKRPVLSPRYLAGVLHRQYRQSPILEESNFSDISSPVCRDDILLPYDNSPYSESDVCSCCHDRFQNVDKYMFNRNRPNIFTTNDNAQDYGRTYYNSNFYDVVPVKDKVTKNKNTIEPHNTKELKKPSIRCWPGKTRLKHRNLATVVNYCTLSHQRGELTGKPAASKPAASTPRRPRAEIDTSPVYPKPEKKLPKQTRIPTKLVQHAATSSPATDNMASRQTATTLTNDDLSGDKTEATLNQIKDILQSVLTEVKTSSKNANPPAQSKRDAVVQNAPAPPARGYEYGASRLLQTYTYSPYNMNMSPYNVNRMAYKASCSHPMPANNYPGPVFPEFAGVPGVPLQQYPLLIQPQKHLCNSYYNNARAMMRHAASAATNTEQAQEHSKETERLIKEIYKSIALNIEESSKDNSVLEYMKTKSITDKYVNLTKSDSDTESERVAKAISEIFKNTNIQDSTATTGTGSTNISYVEDRRSRKAPQEAAAQDRRPCRTERVYAHKETSQYADNKSERNAQHQHSSEESSDNTAVNEESEESSSESETDVVEVKKKEPPKPALVQPARMKEPPKAVEPKKEKSGLFTKMLKMFQPRPRRRRDAGRRDSVTADSEPESESDSDDYQTVYSQKVEPTPKKQVTIVRRPHSKVFYVKQPQHRPRTRSPDKHGRSGAPHSARADTYDRHRRHRDEKRYTGIHCMTRGTGDRERRNTRAYYQNYETRPVLVHHDCRLPQRTARAAARPRYTPYLTPYPRVSELRDDGYPYEATSPYVARSPNRYMKPHFVASKSSSKRGIFSKGWLKKTKIHCGKCSQDWKNLIING